MLGRGLNLLIWPYRAYVILLLITSGISYHNYCHCPPVPFNFATLIFSVVGMGKVFLIPQPLCVPLPAIFSHSHRNRDQGHLINSCWLEKLKLKIKFRTLLVVKLCLLFLKWIFLILYIGHNIVMKNITESELQLHVCVCDERFNSLNTVC